MKGSYVEDSFGTDVHRGQIPASSLCAGSLPDWLRWQNHTSLYIHIQTVHITPIHVVPELQTHLTLTARLDIWADKLCLVSGFNRCTRLSVNIVTI